MFKPKLIVDLELTNKCNASCFMCPRRAIEKSGTGFMSSVIFKKTISRLREYGKISNLSFCGNGEPLLHPKIIDFIKYAKKYKFYVTITTNGSLLTKEIIEKIVNAGVNLINISFSSNNPSIYKKIHIGLNHKLVKRNVENAIKIVKGKIIRRPLINLQISPTQDNKTEMKNFIDYWYKKGIDFCFLFEGQHNKGGNLKRKKGILKFFEYEKYNPDAIEINNLFMPSKSEYKYIARKIKSKCFVKDKVLFIDWEGNYLLCCMDVKRKHKLGNVKENSVSEIIKTKENLLFEEIGLCKKCSLRSEKIKPKSFSFYMQFPKIKIKNFFRRFY